MKKLLTILLVAVTMLTASAQTNTLTLAPDATSGKSEAGSYELTLGGGGTSVDGENEVGLDFSISTNPFKQAPNLWLGLSQGVAWEPKLSGSTDVNANWSWHLFKALYLNTGWSAGVVYSRGDGEFDSYWRTGPEATFQYYVGDNAFVYSGVNYDVITRGESGFRYSFGIGLSF